MRWISRDWRRGMWTDDKRRQDAAARSPEPCRPMPEPLRIYVIAQPGTAVQDFRLRVTSLDEQPKPM